LIALLLPDQNANAPRRGFLPTIQLSALAAAGARTPDKICRKALELHVGIINNVDLLIILIDNDFHLRYHSGSDTRLSATSYCRNEAASGDKSNAEDQFR